MSGNCWKGFQGQRSDVKVIAKKWNALFWQKDTHRLMAVRPLSARRRHTVYRSTVWRRSWLVLAQLAELIVQSVKSCLCVSVIMHLQTCWWTLITNQKLGQSDLVFIGHLAYSRVSWASLPTACLLSAATPSQMLACFHLNVGKRFNSSCRIYTSLWCEWSAKVKSARHEVPGSSSRRHTMLSPRKQHNDHSKQRRQLYRH